MTGASESLPLWGMRALVVEPDQTDRDLFVSTLTSAGLIVTAADSFTSAHTRLVRRPPTILVTEIRLGNHNGLHLAHIARWLRRQMILVVTSYYRDPVLTRDAGVARCDVRAQAAQAGAAAGDAVPRLSCGFARREVNA